MPQLFDRIMQNSMAIWMLVSGLFPIFLFGMLIKAVLHLRRIRQLVKRFPEVPAVPSSWVPAEDWVPSP